MVEKITEKEILIQTAIGSLGEEYRNNLCKHQPTIIAKGKRTCHLCGLKCIDKGDEFYLISLGKNVYNGHTTINVCKSCSWLTIQTINKIIGKYYNKPK